MDESVRIAGELAGVTVTMMLIDVISGYVGAWVTKTVSSSRMREGLAHKGMLILLMLTAGLIDWVQQQGLADLGFKVPLLPAACIYIIWMEINSALENAGEIFPKFRQSRLYSLFASHADIGDAATTAATDKKPAEPAAADESPAPEPSEATDATARDAPAVSDDGGGLPMGIRMVDDA